MGAYLPTPVREKVSEDEESERLRFGSSSMQGWRISQEDAHNCCPNFDKDTSLFAVYDGHGGQEVAQYTSMKFPDFLKQFPKYKEGDVAQALEETFLEFDETLTKEHVIKELTDLAGTAEDEDDDTDEKKECEELCEEADMPIEKLLERYGGQGKVPQSAAVKAVKTAKADFLSPVIKPKTDSPGLAADSSDSADPVKVNLDDQLVNGHSTSSKNTAEAESSNCNEVSCTTDAKTENKSNGDNEVEQKVGSSKDVSSNGSGDNKPEVSAGPSSSSSGSAGGSGGDGAPCVSSTDDAEVGGSSAGGSSSAGRSSSSIDDAPGGSSAGGSGAGSSAGGSGSAQEEPSSSTGRTRSKRRGVIPEDDEDESSFDEEEETTDEEEDSEAEGEPWKSGSSDEEDGEMMGGEEGEECDEVMTGGEEPGSDSGCTAVVAVLKGRELYVANAGDSRCVLCRGGNAFDMSIDHKPEDPIELDRITIAGGRVTMDGRVNGGLNLSRAIGDHVYKTNADLPLKDQMITALPDVKTTTIEETDEFMVLACDGIWNVMSSQNVVDFVRARLKGNQQISTICEEMFEFCLAPDTTGDGSGCDNMTCVIVAFDKLFKSQPESAEESSSAKRAAPEDSELTEGPEAKKQKL